MTLDLSEIKPGEVSNLSDEKLQELMTTVLTLQQEDRRENQILYYQPTSERAVKVHESMAGVLGVGGGNRASKTDTVLAELSALATGVFPEDPHLNDLMRQKFRGPVRIRVVLESLTTVLHPVFLPKLQWWKWNGIDEPGGERGHWGWIPKSCLIDGKWEKSWSEKLRTLTVKCRDPDEPSRVLGESTFQFMSHDQDPSDFASGSFHHVMHDEPPSWAIWRENTMRTLDVSGRCYLVMTWPDDPSIPVDWIYDEIYDKGVEGPDKDPNVDWMELYTTENPNLPQEEVQSKMMGMSEAERSVRFYGQPIRFSNLIHPLFTENEKTWCFRCGKNVFRDGDKCASCGAQTIENYCHVVNFDHDRAWPCVFVMDPHPRKPHMFGWFQIDPADDVWMVQEGELDGDPGEVRAYIDRVEQDMNLQTKVRMMDPNMGRSPASSKRNVTWQDEFEDAGLLFDLADDSEIGRARVNEYLKPDPATLRPRFHVHTRCRNTIMQFKRFAWDDFRKSADRDLKQKPRTKYDDMPACARYLMNFEPSFSILHHGAPIITRVGKRKGAY